MAQVTYRGVKYNTERKAVNPFCEKIVETYRGIKHEEIVCREEARK